jgi:hypothetical protein
MRGKEWQKKKGKKEEKKKLKCLHNGKQQNIKNIQKLCG